MPQYDIYVSCKECDGIHPMGIGVYLNVGPAYEDSVSETYSAKAVPPQILAIQRHKTLCLKTGKWFVQENFYNIFLKQRGPAAKTDSKGEKPTARPVGSIRQIAAGRL